MGDTDMNQTLLVLMLLSIGMVEFIFISLTVPHTFKKELINCVPPNVFLYSLHSAKNCKSAHISTFKSVF